jgi:hypothetical protein
MTLFEESLALARELKDLREISAALNNVGMVARAQGDNTRAEACFTQSLELDREIGDKLGIASNLASLADIAGACDQPQRAACLLGATAALLAATDAALEPPDKDRYDQNIVAVRTFLSEADFATAWTAGQAMSQEQAIAYALGIDD